MDIDQLAKRIQWIEEERRKEKDALALVENRIIDLEGRNNALVQQNKELNSEITRLSALLTRMDQFDELLMQVRIENKRMVDEVEKAFKQQMEEAEKVRRVEIKPIEAAQTDLRKELELLPRLDKGLQGRIEEENRLRRLIEEMNLKIDESHREEENYIRTFRLLEDGRKQDAKRILDLQGEVAALRKRADDQRGQIEVINVNVRKVETRINELVAVEAERRDATMNFIDKQNLAYVERERIWKDWQIRFETIEKQSADAETKLLSLDATQREAKRSQSVVEDLTQRVDRRINEITEIQRLSEDRFRQEWVTFKSDDQKRWTNYTLTQEEQRSEVLRQFERYNDRTTRVEDALQELQDLLQQVNGEIGRRLQTLLALAHEWVSSYERTSGRSS